VTGALVVVPFLALGLLVFAFKTSSWRHALMCAAVCWGVFLAAATEALSALGVISPVAILVAWAGFCIAVTLIRRFQRTYRRAPDAAPVHLAPVSRVQILAIFSVVLLLGVTALVAAPNNADAMDYHMSRVTHWIQNRSVSHYPTHILRQLHANPWADWAVMHLQLLAGGDRPANLVSWLGMVGSLVGASLTARRLGADARGQILAAIAVTTIPIGIMEATTAKNDFVLSFWLVSFVYFVLQLKTAEGPAASRLDAIMAGASLGLAVLTKATAYLFALPFLVWLAVPRPVTSWGRAGRATATVLTLCLLLNLGHYWRNVQVYGSPLGADREDHTKYANETLTLPLLVSNVVRNLSLHLDTRVASLNALANQGVRSLHEALGLNVNDPRTTWFGPGFEAPQALTDSDTAGNLPHLVLAILALGLCGASARVRRARNLAPYGVGLLAAFLLFCGYLRWQPWHSRLHLPLFVLAAPIIGVAFGHRFGCRVTAVVAAALVLWALPPLLQNDARPLLGPRSIFFTSRESQYFNNRPELERPYLKAARFLKASGCGQIGLYRDVGWEYPLWPLLRGRRSRARIEHIQVDNVSRIKANLPTFATFSPCAVIFFQPAPFDEVVIELTVYKKEWWSGRLSIFLKSSRVGDPEPAPTTRRDGADPGNLAVGRLELVAAD
jgi:hypothetical protein